MRKYTGDLRPHARREERQLVPRQQVTREPERHRHEEQSHAADPRELARRPVGLEEHDAEQVHERHEDHEVRAPRVDGADEPSELDLGHEELNGLVGALRARPVVEEEQNARDAIWRPNRKSAIPPM